MGGRLRTAERWRYEGNQCCCLSWRSFERLHVETVAPSHATVTAGYPSVLHRVIGGASGVENLTA
jgi:hypothetical protein